jgi:uncharacterized membrane protein YraQ (UPF0718 family)
MDQLLRVLQAGAGNLAAYLAGHVLLCLLPAFFIAGAMTALTPRSGVSRWLGRDAPARVSYPPAALAGSLIAVCSRTIVTLFAGIHRKGAGLGPGFAVARLILWLCFGVGIGLLMAAIFRRDDALVSAAVNPLARVAPIAASSRLSRARQLPPRAFRPRCSR